MLILVLPAAGNMLFFHHTLTSCVFPSCLPGLMTHSGFDWQLTLMIHTSPPICLSTFHSSEEAFRCFVFSKQERLISQFVQTFSFCHLECLPANTLKRRLLGYRVCRARRAAVQDSRMCGGNFTGFSHAWKIALQPFYFLHHSVVHVCLCMFPRLCLSFLAHIQNGKGKNNQMFQTA